jgi:hypothetical protein
MARKRAVKINGSKTSGSTVNGTKANESSVHVRAHVKKEEHPTGLWVDADVFARLRSGNGETLKKETFSATQHYLDLAALVLDGKKERKKRSRNKNSNGSAAE